MNTADSTTDFSTLLTFKFSHHITQFVLINELTYSVKKFNFYLFIYLFTLLAKKANCPSESLRVKII